MMSFTVDVTDEIWNAFVDAYERKRGTTSTTYDELRNETCKVMRDAIKAYAMSSNDEPRKHRTAKEETTCEQDTSVMIPVHDWIWQDFKEMYAKRNKDKAMTDKDFIEVVHDWACRAMQHYTYDNIDNPWKLAKTSEIALEAYEIALDCPGIHIRRDRDVWIVNALHMFDTEARNAAELLRMVKGAKKYIETSEAVKQEPAKHRTAKEVIDEAKEIAASVPRMHVYNKKIPGYASAQCWGITFIDDTDYKAEAQGAEQLLEKVREAKACWEASQKSKKGYQATRDMIHETMEKSKKDNEGVIRVDGLDQETKELLLHFIDNLTIKEVSDILAKDYPCSVWDELHFIREKLRASIAEPRRRP